MCKMKPEKLGGGDQTDGSKTGLICCAQTSLGARRMQPPQFDQGQESNVGAHGCPATGILLSQARRIDISFVGEELLHFLLWSSLRNEMFRLANNGGAR
jgi:hypothetical protein